MAGEGVLTICGNVTGEPDLRFGQDGAARCTWTLAVNARVKGPDGSWADGEATFYRVTAWRQLGENVAQSVAVGTRMVVHGKFKTRKYTTDNGVERLSLDVEAEYAGPDLRFAVASVSKASRDGGSSGGFGGQQRQEPVDDPWGQPAGGSGAMDPTEPPFAP